MRACQRINALPHVKELKNLEAERLPDRDRRYIVRTISTMLLSTIPHPTIHDCSVPARILVKQYPFLADASENGKKPHVKKQLPCSLE